MPRAASAWDMLRSVALIAAHWSGNGFREKRASFSMTSISRGLVSYLNRHPPDSRRVDTRIAPLIAVGNGKSPSSRAEGDRSRWLTVAKRQTRHVFLHQGRLDGVD